jgi:hypothetical protein
MGTSVGKPNAVRENERPLLPFSDDPRLEDLRNDFL